MQHVQIIKRTNNHLKQHPFLYGVGFTWIIAAIGFLLAKLPFLEKLGPLAIAIILSIIYRQLFSYPIPIASGIQFTTKYLLRFAIILYGLKLNVHLIFSDGLTLIAKDIIVVVIAIFAMLGLAHIMKADKQIALLTGVGTGICGAAAILVIAPIVKAKEKDTAISVGMIALIGTIFSLGYLLIEPLLSLTPDAYGIWAGMSLHELAHVALSVAPFGDDVVAIAFLTKLARVFLLIPVAFVFIYIMKRKEKGTKTEAKIAYPYFLLGFIGLSFLNSYVFEPFHLLSDTLYDGLNSSAAWLLTMAMVGLGLNVELKDLQAKTFRTLIVLVIVSLIVSLLAYMLVK